MPILYTYSIIYVLKHFNHQIVKCLAVTTFQVTSLIYVIMDKEYYVCEVSGKAVT